MNYHKNLEVIARGKGSPQARYEDELCWGKTEECDEEEIENAETGE